MYVLPFFYNAFDRFKRGAKKVAKAIKRNFSTEFRTERVALQSRRHALRKCAGIGLGLALSAPLCALGMEIKPTPIHFETEARKAMALFRMASDKDAIGDEIALASSSSDIRLPAAPAEPPVASDGPVQSGYPYPPVAPPQIDPETEVQKILAQARGLTDDAKLLADMTKQMKEDGMRTAANQAFKHARLVQAGAEFEKIDQSLKVATADYKEAEQWVSASTQRLVEIKNANLSREKCNEEITKECNKLAKQNAQCCTPCSGGRARRWNWLKILFIVLVIALFITLIATSGGGGAAASVAFL